MSIYLLFSLVPSEEGFYPLLQKITDGKNENKKEYFEGFKYMWK